MLPLFLLCSGFLAIAGPELSPLQARESSLEIGVRQIDEGDFEAGILTLDAVARVLEVPPANAKDSARAYLYLGVGYLGLGQESIARAKFRLALQKDPDLRLTEDQFSRRVVRAFDSARETLRTNARWEKEARKKRGKTPYVLAGAGVAAALGAAAVITGSSANGPPTASFTTLPEGQALAETTVVTFAAAASDPEGDPLVFVWDFGDGTQGAGPIVDHVFEREGEYQVKLETQDLQHVISTSGSVTVRTVTGQWHVGVPVSGATEYRLAQSPGRNVGVAAEPGDGSSVCGNWGRLYSPRRIEFDVRFCLPGDRGSYNVVLKGEMDPTLQTITGTWTFLRGGVTEVVSVSLTRY